MCDDYISGLLMAKHRLGHTRILLKTGF